MNSFAPSRQTNKNALMSIRFPLLASVLLACLVAYDDKPAENARGAWGAAAKVGTAEVKLKPIVDEIQAIGSVGGLVGA